MHVCMYLREFTYIYTYIYAYTSHKYVLWVYMCKDVCVNECMSVLSLFFDKTGKDNTD